MTHRILSELHNAAPYDVNPQGGIEMNNDTAATVVGAVTAAGMAAGPILGSLQGGSLHQGDWLQLLTAVCMAVLGFFTNRKETNPGN